ncbi:hypothetical protein TNCV_3810981 [Trichonephila clavipes]|nr:hypothetical protein TNCV_3810981 [Trichonephila clavipes]
MAALVMGLTITTVLQPGALRLNGARGERDVYVWHQLALGLHVVGLDELNKYWSVEGIQGLIAVCRNCGGGDRGRVAIYRLFGELRRAKIVLSPVWCSRPTTGVPLAHATMNFVGLDLTASDRWHQKTTTTTTISSSMR